MKSKNLTYFSIVASMLLFLSILNACGPKKTHLTGGADFGGGGTQGSELGQVEAIFKDDKKLRSELTQIFTAVLQDNVSNSERDAIYKMRQELKINCVGNVPQCGWDKVGQFIDSVKFNLQYDKPCLDALDNEQDASVNLATKSHSICLNVKNLKNIPSESLKKQIHALIIHELSHLLGIVNEAKTIQSEVLDHYDRFLTRNNISADLKRLFSIETNRFTCLVDYMISYLQTNPNVDLFKDRLILSQFTEVGKLYEDVQSTEQSLENFMKDNAKELNNDNAFELAAVENLKDTFFPIYKHANIITTMVTYDLNPNKYVFCKIMNCADKNELIKKLKSAKQKSNITLDELSKNIPTYKIDDTDFSCKSDTEKRRLIEN